MNEERLREIIGDSMDMEHLEIYHHPDGMFIDCMGCEESIAAATDPEAKIRKAIRAHAGCYERWAYEGWSPEEELLMDAMAYDGVWP